MTALRRIVTGNSDRGRSHIVSDGPPVELGTLAELWATESAPAGYGSDDEVAGRRVKLEPPENGTVFRFFRVDPEDPNKSREEVDQEVAAAFSFVGAEHCRPDTSKNPRMHTTSSVDYIVLLQGEVTLLLDDEVDLKPYDAVVQRGTNHAWINKTSEPALLVAALAQGRWELLDAATQDRLHQPARAEIFTALYDIFDAAKEAGAHAAYLSGGGSTVAALATENEERIARLMQQAGTARGYSGRSQIREPNLEGARVL